MRLYNTLTRKVDEFAPADDTVKMYVCGPNLYAPCHVGHAMSYVVFDTLRRYLEYRGYKVRHVQNFTDIEDKIIARAQAMNVSTDELARQYVDRFFVDMDRLRIQRAHVYPLATHEIPGMIEMVQGLIAKGHAYPVEGDVYFRVTSDPRLRQAFRPLAGRPPGGRAHRSRRAQGAPDGLRALEGFEAGRAVVGEPVGTGTPGLAHRVLRHVAALPGGDAGHPRRRPGPHLPASRERAGAVGELHGHQAVRALLGAQRPGAPERRRGEDDALAGQPRRHHRRARPARRRHAAPVHPQLQLSQPAHLRRRAAGGGEARRRAAAHGGARGVDRRRRIRWTRRPSGSASSRRWRTI